VDKLHSGFLELAPPAVAWGADFAGHRDAGLMTPSGSWLLCISIVAGQLAINPFQPSGQHLPFGQQFNDSFEILGGNFGWVHGFQDTTYATFTQHFI
jgi:hypothetical protein